MKKPGDIIDREDEWSTLVELWHADGGQLVFMHGRRRVGKSWLLQRFARAVDGVYYQATRGTRSEQVARLTRVVGERFDDPALRRGAALPGWEELLDYLTDMTAGEPFLLVLDEFPYLAEEDPALTSVLQSFWDHRWKDGAFKLLLCGSHISLMRRLEEHDQPLHGRRTARMSVSPFLHHHVGRFVPDYDARDRLRTYGIFGGLPGHLDRLAPERSLARNVCRLILDPTSRLHDEATHVLDSFGQEADVHYSVLFAIATGAHTWSEIKSRVDRTEGSLWPVIEWLQEMELIEREVPVTKDQPHKSKVSQYRITDPYLRFWHRFVQPIYSAGSSAVADPETLWRGRIRPDLDTYMGGIFEDACRDHLRTRAELPFERIRVGRWWTRTSSEEVDVVVRGVNDELFVAECKWGGVDGRDLRTLRDRARDVAREIGSVPEVHLGLFSGADEPDAEVQRAIDDGEVRYRSAGDLFG